MNGDDTVTSVDGGRMPQHRHTDSLLTTSDREERP